MIGPSLCALLLLGGPLDDPRPLLVARYRQFNDATARNDGAAMVAWYRRHSAPSFRYTSKDGNTFPRNAFLKGLAEQSRSIQQALKSDLKVSRFEVKGDTAVATVSSEFEGKLRFDTALLRLVDKSTARDTWKRAKSGWLLVQSVQIKADTQMFEK